MSEKYILYNPYAGEAEAQEAINSLINSYKHSVPINICKISSYEAFFNGLEPDAEVILCGGDGTLNYFANGIQGINFSNPVYYFPTGTGNDFARDIGYAKYSEPAFRIDPYLKRLPTVTVNGLSRLFVNNVGFGIDGYCCETGDEIRIQNKSRKKPKPINYTKIAINGLLFHFKPRHAFVTVDGRIYSYDRVWLAPVMNGRYYGGGMMAAPKQDRLNHTGTVSVVVFHDVGKLRALTIFPSIFRGEHIKYKKQMSIHTGNSIHVQFDTPAPLQIDGETIPNVKEYDVFSFVPADVSEEPDEAVIFA